MKALLFPLFFIAGTYIYGQSSVFSFAGGGDAPIARSYTTSAETQVQQSGQSYTTTAQSVKAVSLGQGGNVSLAYDWFSKKDIGFGVKLNAFFGAPFVVHGDQTTSAGDHIQYTVAQRGISGQFIPHFSARHDFKKVCPVLEIGMMIGVNGIKEDYEGYYNGSNQVKSTIWERGGATFGFYSSLGVWIKVSRVVRFSLAAHCIVSSYSPTHWERTSFLANGRDQLSQLAVSDVKGDYVTDINSSTPQYSGAPRKSLKYSAPFSGVGFNIGFAFVFENRKNRITNEKDKRVVHPF
ncbi:MAG: hypothetical protein JSS76_07950 [Bacteroidetes bacterium]|nr:hypothetical protein [Bacteroidota bacterium]